MFAVICVLVLLFLSYYSYHVNLKRRPGYPPGPPIIFLFGSMLSIGVDPHIAFTKFQKKYGPIIGFKLADNWAVCVHGLDLIKEIYNNPLISGRKTVECLGFIFGDQYGVAMSSGEIWTEQRRFALRHLRDFGFGKSSMEELILEEVNEIVDWLRRQNGAPVTLLERFALAVTNSVWQILSGERFEHDDEQLHKVLQDMQRSAKLLFSFDSLKTFFLFFPTFAKTFPNWSGWNNLVKSKEPREALFDRIIQQHQETLSDIPRDFVDVYLQEINRTKDPTSSFYQEQGIKSLKSVMADFFIASTDTTSITLTWLCLYLLHNPRVQRKLQDELDRVIGRSRAPRLSDRKNLPYTESVILETLRLSSIVPSAAPHLSEGDVNFHGFNIPKGTMVFANIHANHHDPEIWGEDAEEFKPERFLSPDKTTVIRHEALIPFSVGRRNCIGETLARDTLFLFVSHLAQNFTISAEDGCDPPPLKFKPGQLTLTPISSTVVMKERMTN